MPPEVVAAALLSALMHASWNAFVKGSADPLIGQTIVIAGGAMLLAPLAPLVPLPSASDAPYLLLSTLIHNLYYAGLVSGYRHGDLAVVYPIARGTAPMLVSLLAMAFGETVDAQTIVGVSAISFGILMLGFDRLSATKPIVYALATGVFIASYTYVDGRGVQNTAKLLTFLIWLHVFSAIPITAYVLLRHRAALFARVRASRLRALTGGAVAMAGYCLVLWAYRRSAIPPIAALRETSVLFGTLFAALYLKEPVGALRWSAALVVFAGMALVSL